MNITVLALALAAATATVPVTADNFPRAESDMYFQSMAVKGGGFGKFNHARAPMPIAHQTVIRPNRDTLYSSMVADLDAGPMTVVMPDAAGRFMSLMSIDEDHYVHSVDYTAGRHVFNKEGIGTRYVMLGVRTLVNPSDPNDMAKVRELQDAIRVEQQGGPGKFEVPKWDPKSQKRVRDALLVLASGIPDFKGAFGAKDQVDPVRHLIGTAAGWGGNPEKDAMYLSVTPEKNDGKTVYRLTVKDVPVDAFWSISVYDARGYFQQNSWNAYSLNDLSAKKSEDGSVAVRLGGCNGKIPNCLPTMPGWNYTVRLYRPRTEILDGRWTFPKPEPVK